MRKMSFIVFYDLTQHSEKVEQRESCFEITCHRHSTAYEILELIKKSIKDEMYSWGSYEIKFITKVNEIEIDD